jgi:hypothetical protein
MFPGRASVWELTAAQVAMLIGPKDLDKEETEAAAGEGEVKQTGRVKTYRGKRLYSTEYLRRLSEQWAGDEPPDAASMPPDAASSSAEDGQDQPPA